LSYEFNAFYFGFPGSYHFNELLDLNTPEFDLYAGINLGFRNFAWREDTLNGLGNVYGSGVFAGLFVGSRYYFQNNFGAFGELGIGGSSNSRLGISFRF
jgi:hypothetical protein